MCQVSVKMSDTEGAPLRTPSQVRGRGCLEVKQWPAAKEPRPEADAAATLSRDSFLIAPPSKQAGETGFEDVGEHKTTACVAPGAPSSGAKRREQLGSPARPSWTKKSGASKSCQSTTEASVGSGDAPWRGNERGGDADTTERRGMKGTRDERGRTKGREKGKKISRR